MPQANPAPEPSFGRARGLVQKLIQTGESVSCRIGEAGRLRIERPSPLLMVVRSQAGEFDPNLLTLLKGSNTLLVAPDSESTHWLLRELSSLFRKSFGASLFLEIWAGVAGSECLQIYSPKDPELLPLTTDLQNDWVGLRISGQPVRVRVSRVEAPSPPGLTPLLDGGDAREFVYGLEMPPIYHSESGELYPLVLRELRREITPRLRRFGFVFLNRWTSERPESYQVLGSRRIERAAQRVAAELDRVASRFDFLLFCTPTNTAEAWEAFQASDYQEIPRLQYRPFPADPVLLKRELYAAPVERVDDPALYQLFREKQDELDRQITLMVDLNTSRFRPGSVQLYGDIEDGLLSMCRELLEVLPPPEPETLEEGVLPVQEFAARAQAEIDYLKSQWEGVTARVEVRPDITGLMVSRGSLLIGADAAIPPWRAEALIQHEVGTHVLTYFNGKAQPFRQLCSGLAGYDPLQEGIAVLAEALVGGLDIQRRRLLAGRVVAVRHLIDGATFVETFRELHDGHGFTARVAFIITLRVYRGGGLAKDAVYVRGVMQLLDYLREGGEIEPLLVGKIAPQHIPIVDELRAREILKPPPLRPRFLDLPGAQTKLERIRSGLTLVQMLADRHLGREAEPDPR